MCAVYICYADDSLEKFGALPQGYLEAQRWKKKEEGGGEGGCRQRIPRYHRYLVLNKLAAVAGLLIIN